MSSTNNGSGHSCAKSIVEDLDSTFIHPFGTSNAEGPLATKSIPTSFNVGTSGRFFVRASLKNQLPELAGIHLRSPSGRVRYRMDMVPKQCIDRVCYILEWHADPLNTLLLRDLKHGRIKQAVRRGYSIIDLAWPRFRICQELKKCSPGRVASHRDTKSVGAELSRNSNNSCKQSLVNPYIWQKFAQHSELLSVPFEALVRSILGWVRIRYPAHEPDQPGRSRDVRSCGYTGSSRRHANRTLCLADTGQHFKSPR
jgi:hypothetical protein